MSQHIPPHLPKPMSNIKNHQLQERLKVISIAAIISLLAGLAGASVLFGWLLPNGYGDNILISSQSKSGATQLPEELIQKELMGKIYNVYSKTIKTGEIEYVEENDWLGQAIAISSDGWLVMYSPQDLTNSAISLISDKNKLEKITSKTFDKQTNLLFIKIETSNQPKPVSIKNDISVNDQIYLFDNSRWIEKYIDRKISSGKGNHLDISATDIYTVRNEIKSGYIAFNLQGNLVGFIVENNQLLPSKYLSRMISGFLSSKKITYSSLGVSGFFLDEKNIIGDNKDGFIVSSIYSSLQNKLRVGDMILEINGSIVGEDSLWYNIINKKSVNITLLRNGKKIQLDNVPVINL